MLHLLRRPKASRARSVAAAVAAAAARYPAECDKIMASLGLWREPAKRASRKLDLPHVVAPGKGAIAHMSASNGVRRQLYDALAAQVDIDGLSFGKHMTQGLQQDSLFHFDADGRASARLHKLEVPVRAIVAPFSNPATAAALAGAVAAHLVPALPPGALWLQDSSLYHSTIWHASRHTNPVAATAEEVAAEVAAVRAAARTACPLQVALERVVVTSGGTIMAAWQVVAGTEPEELRHDLAVALPRAPPADQQAVKQPAVVYTTLARLLVPPGGALPAGAAAAAVAAAESMTVALCATTTTLQQLWYIEETDLLALALGGAFRKQPLPLLCQSDPDNRAAGS